MSQVHIDDAVAAYERMTFICLKFKRLDDEDEETYFRPKDGKLVSISASIPGRRLPCYCWNGTRRWHDSVAAIWVPGYIAAEKPDRRQMRSDYFGKK